MASSTYNFADTRYGNVERSGIAFPSAAVGGKLACDLCSGYPETLLMIVTSIVTDCERSMKSLNCCLSVDSKPETDNCGFLCRDDDDDDDDYDNDHDIIIRYKFLVRLFVKHAYCRK